MRKASKPSLLSPLPRKQKDNRVLEVEFPATDPAEIAFFKEMESAKGPFNPSAYFVVLQDYAVQSSGNMSFCGIVEQFAVHSVPVTLPFGFAVTFFSRRKKTKFTLKFSGSPDPNKPIFEHEIEGRAAGYRHAIFQVVDCVAARIGPQFFSAYLDGKLFQRYPVLVVGLSPK